MTDIVDVRALQIIDLIKANRYAIYDLTQQELDRVLHQTYLRKNSFAMVVKVSEEASWWGMYNRQYNECRLEYVPEPSGHWLTLSALKRLRFLNSLLLSFRGVVKAPLHI